MASYKSIWTGVIHTGVSEETVNELVSLWTAIRIEEETTEVEEPKKKKGTK